MGRNWRREAKLYDYECTLTGERFRLKKEAKNPEELVSVKAYYELHPEKDDRPEVIKKKVHAEEVMRAPRDSSAQENESEGEGEDQSEGEDRSESKDKGESESEGKGESGKEGEAEKN